ncbi:hypothetical protein DOJK_01352 [Patescibacteria group bacterium]|nr:hypothetical protein DOJK_01352 [Patescibacteria group bacterium]
MRRMDKTVCKFSSFEEQEKFEKEYWQKATAAEKFEVVEAIRVFYIRTFYPDFTKIEMVVRKR